MLACIAATHMDVSPYFNSCLFMLLDGFDSVTCTTCFDQILGGAGAIYALLYTLFRILQYMPFCKHFSAYALQHTPFRIHALQYGPFSIRSGVYALVIRSSVALFRIHPYIFAVQYARFSTRLFVYALQTGVLLFCICHYNTIQFLLNVASRR